MVPNAQNYPPDFNTNYQRFNYNQYPSPDSIQMQQNPPSYYSSHSSYPADQNQNAKNSIYQKT
jgi:hypothetical protein